MKTKRLTSILLALLMVVGLCVPAFAVETPAPLILSVDKTEVTVGDTITVTISCDTEITGIQGWGMDLYLDNRAYKLVDSAIYGGYNEMFGEVTDNIETHSSVNISAFSMNSKYLLTIPNGTLATLTFEVIDASTETFQLEDVGAMRPDEATNNLLAETSNAVSVIAKNPNDAVIYQYQGSGNPCSHAYLDTVVLKDMKDSVLMVAEEGNWPVVLLDGTKVKSGDTITMYITKAGEKVDELTVRNNTYVFGANEITVTDNLYITDLLLEHYFDPCYRSNSFGPRFCLINLTIDQAELALKVGETGTLVANTNSARNNRISQYITWSSDNEAVATVSGGTVTAVGAGTATITASIGTMSVSCEVTVAHNFDGVILKSNEMTSTGKWGPRFASVPAGEDVMIILDTKGALQLFDDIITGTRLAHTFTADCEITVTADELAKYFIDEEWRGYLLDYGITPDENNEYVWLHVFNGSMTYEFVLEIVFEQPEQPAAEGYTVEMPADKTVVAGEIVEVPVVVGNADGSAYNAFDMSFTYDASVLELTSTEIKGMTVEAANGTVRVVRYGDDLNIDTAAFTLTFKAIGNGTANIVVTSAKVDIAENAADFDAPEAVLLDDTTVVTVNGYAVALPEEFEGAPVANPGEDYTFTAKDKNYEYTFEGSTMGGQNVVVKDNGDGTFTVEDVNGALVIKTEKTGKKFDVTLGEDMEGAEEAQYMTDYEATLTKEAGYGYKPTVTISGNAYTGFEYNEETGVVTIPGEDITGEIVFDSGKEAGEFTVTFEGSGAGDAEGEAVAEGGKEYSFTITKAAGCIYTVSYKMGDGDAVELEEADGKYTIEKVTDNIVITIEKESDLAVEVRKYVELDGKTIFLVTATQTLADGKALAYDGTVMYFAEQYNAWAYLVVVDEGQSFTADDAKAAITTAEAEYTVLEQTFDVNMTNIVDVNDAQLVYNIYNCEYDSIVDMQKFLNADVNGDKTVNVTDAAAVVSNID